MCGEGPDKPGKELRPLCRMVNLLDADLLALQEVGSAATLRAFNALLKEPYAHSGCLVGNNNRSIHLAVLSRVPVQLTSHRAQVLTDPAGEVLMHQGQPLRLQRDLLLVRTALPDRTPLALFVLHLKSRTSPGADLELSADDIRAAEARAVAALVAAHQQRHADDLILLAGDFNDTVYSDALEPLRHWWDPHGEQLRARGRNPSTYWPKRRARFDRILLCSRSAARLDAASPTIHSGHMARTASDHYPVSLELN